MKTVQTAFEGGWTMIKLYFMIGLPTETMEDVAGIAHLGQQVVEAYYSNPKASKGKKCKGNVQCFLFCAKPFTPFQWEPQDSIETL